MTIDTGLHQLSLACKSLIVDSYAWRRRTTLSSKVEHDLWLWPAKFELLARWFNLLLGFGKNLLEVLLDRVC